MGFLDWLLGRSTASGTPSPDRPKPSPRLDARALTGGRVSTDKGDDFFAVPFVGDGDPNTVWSSLALDAQSLLRASPSDLTDLLIDLSPEVSRALWDFIRMCNPGWEVTVTLPGSDRPSPKGQKAIDDFLDRLKGLYGSADTVWNLLFVSAFLGGAFCAELVLDERGRVPVDMVVPDPRSIRFQSRSDPVRGKVWIPGQYHGIDFSPLDLPTFRYIGIDRLPGKAPYGRPLASSALFVAVFMIALLHDLRRVVQQQGYPRLDVSIDLEAIAQAFPGISTDVARFQEFIREQLAIVAEEYEDLEPDDAFIHTSAVQVNRPVGAVDASSLGAIGGLIESLERQAVRALKTMPLMMGITDGVSEANANRQWEIYAQGIKSLQHMAESLLERLLEVALQAQGIQGNVTFRFSELRAAEELRDQQTLQLKIANFEALEAAGYVSREEASVALVGHPPAVSDAEREAKQKEALAALAAATAPAPATTPTGDGQEPAPAENADPGAAA